MQGQVPRSVQLFFPDAKVVYPKVMPEEAAFTHVDQIAFVTSDIDGAIDTLGGMYGWGPWYVIPSVSGRAGKNGCDGSYRIKLAFSQVGPLEIELIQPLEGNTPFYKHLSQLGAGIFHLRCTTRDVEGACHRLAEKGLKTDWEHWDQGILINAYLERLAKLGLRLELVLETEALRAQGFKAQKGFRSVTYITD